MVSVILPIHNEEQIIYKTITSLLYQTYSKITIHCVIDNCTDNTERILKENFAGKIELYKTLNNKYKKSGALNQFFQSCFDSLSDYILIMDSDTVLDRDAVEEAVHFLNENINYGVVCSKAGIITKTNRNFMWHIQNIEYGRFDTDRTETQGYCMVAHGMFSLYHKNILERIRGRGFIYDINCITEDYELTLAIKCLGYKVGHSLKIKAYTDVPLKFRDYWVQRIRWMTGGLYAIGRYKFNRHTAKDKLGHALFLLLFSTQMFLIVSSIINKWVPIGWGLAVIIGLSYINAVIRYKYVTLKSVGTFLFALTLIPDLFISWCQTLVMLNAYVRYCFNIQTEWR